MNELPKPTLPGSMPVSVGSYFFGIFIGTAITITLSVADAFARGNPEAGLALVASPIALLLDFLLNSLIGLPPFFLLRKTTPALGVRRFAFVMTILAPAVWLCCTVGGLWLDGFRDYSPYFSSPRPPLLQRLNKTMVDLWPTLLAVVFASGFAMWVFDRRVWIRNLNMHN